MGQPIQTGSQYRVLFFTTFVSTESGASYALRETVRRLSSRGIRVTLVIPESKDSRYMFPQSEFEVEYLEMPRPRQTINCLQHAHYLLSIPRTIFAICNTIRARRIGIVHMNEITDLIGGIAARLSRVRTVCHVRTDGIPNPYRSLVLLALEATSNSIIVPSRSTAAWLSSDRPRLAGRI